MTRIVISTRGMIISGVSLFIEMIIFDQSGGSVVMGIFIIVTIMLMILFLYGLMPPKSQTKPCSSCKGSGYVPAVGAWVSEYDSDPCPHCGGTGKYPEAGTFVGNEAPDGEKCQSDDNAWDW